MPYSHNLKPESNETFHVSNEYDKVPFDVLSKSIFLNLHIVFSISGDLVGRGIFANYFFFDSVKLNYEETL